MNQYQFYRSVLSISALLRADRIVCRASCGVKPARIFLLVAMMLPFIVSAQVDAGGIAKSQCITSGSIPSLFTSLRDAAGSGITITWEKTTVDNTFTSGVSTIATGVQSYQEAAVAVTTYYRRVVTSGGVPVYSNVITVSIVGSVVNPTFNPSVPPFPIICQGTTSFPVNYTTTNTPDQYSIIWDATAAAAGFTDAVNLTLAATPGSFNVSVPSNAPANTYNGTLIAVNTGTGCTVSNSSSVLINPLPTVSITPPAAVCAPSSIDLTNANITNGSTADTYTRWNDALATSSLTNANAVTATGVYYIKGTITATGCSVIKPVTATINPLPTATVTAGGPTSFCAGGSVTLTSSAGNSYSWNSGQTSQAIVVSAGANYAVTVTNAAGCSLSSSVTTVVVNPLPTVTITTPAAVCAPATIDLTNTNITTGSTADTYTRWNDALATSSLTNANAVTASGVYYIKGTIGATGCSVIQSVTATINQLPTATITAGGPTSFCAGGSVTLTSSVGNSYSWNSGQTSQAIVVSAGANYAVTVTSAAGCSRSSSVTTVVVNPLPTVNITTPAAVCAPATINLTSAGITAGSTANFYTQWNDVLAVSSLTNANAVTASGVYYIKGTIGATGCSVIKPVTATINQLPTATITAGGPTTFCTGGSVILTSSAGNAYSWNSGQTSQAIVVSAGANYAVTVTSAAGCSSASAVTPVVVNPIPAVTITTPSAVCAPVTVNLTTAAITNGSTPGLVYTYWTDAAATSSLTNTTAINTSGTYYIKGTSPSGCSMVQPVSVIINTLPTVNITNPAAVCAPSVINLTSPSITAGSTAGINFTYFTDAAAANILSTPAAVSSSGIYYIKGVLPSTGCTLIKLVAVTVNALPVININNPAAVCEPATVDLSAPAVTSGSSLSTTFTYWTDAANTIALITPASVAISGTYYIKGTVAGSCSASKPVSVMINPLPTGVLQPPSVTYICDGLSQTLTASGANSYQWYLDQNIITGATAASYTATVGGNYTVQFVSKDGCTRNAANAIALDLFVKPIVAFNADSRCAGSLIHFTNNSSYASSGTVSWLWDLGDGSFSNNLSATHIYTSAADYAVVLTANNISCPNLTTAATVNYSVETALPGIRYDTIYSIGNRSFIINARSFGVGYLWQPSTGLRNAAAQSTIINLDSSVSYTVAITSAAGCVTTDSVFVKITNDGEIYVPQGFTPNGDGMNDRAYPILIGIKQLNYFKIFNRWGNIVFQTNDAAPQNGWDGKYLGKMQPTGTYAWIAEAIDGHGNIIRRGGNILLLK